MGVVKWRLAVPYNRIRLRALIIMLSSICLAFAAPSSWSQVPNIAAQPMLGVGEIEFENESITVLRLHMAPHEKTPMHDIVSARLVIWLTDAHLRDTGSDGSVTEYNRRAGSIDWIMPRRHMGENLSDQGLDFLAIIPKVVSASAPHGMHPR
jgi:hypothetical protein